MSNKKEITVDKFLESNNMDYLFCILAEKESERLSVLPDSVKKDFNEKITTMALKHIAMNSVPDYIIEEADPTERRDLDSVEYIEEYEDDRKDKLSKDIDVFDNYNNNFTDDYEDNYIDD